MFIWFGGLSAELGVLSCRKVVNRLLTLSTRKMPYYLILILSICKVEKYEAHRSLEFSPESHGFWWGMNPSRCRHVCAYSVVRCPSERSWACVLLVSSVRGCVPLQRQLYSTNFAFPPQPWESSGALGVISQVTWTWRPVSWSAWAAIRNYHRDWVA